MKKLLNIFLLAFSLLSATSLSFAVDASIKGDPSSISASGYPIGKPSMYERTRRMPSKYGNTRGRSIMDMYQGSSHQRMLRSAKSKHMLQVLEKMNEYLVLHIVSNPQVPRKAS